MGTELGLEAGLSAASQSRGNPSHFDKQRAADKLFEWTTRGCALTIVALLIAITIILFKQSLPSIRQFGLAFLTSSEWNPVAERFGALTPLVGTLVTSAIALSLSVPVSFGIALFLEELSPRWIKGPLGIAIELLAAIPSIIYGMWGLFVLSPVLARTVEPWISHTLGRLPVLGKFFDGAPFGIGVFTAGLILAIMITPFIASVMRDVLAIIPRLLKESAYGLGATTWEVVWNVMLPEAKQGMLGGILLGLGRALGETMAVTFVIGNSHVLSASLLAPGSTISSTLANEFTEAVGTLYVSSLIELGLILFLITLAVLALARLILPEKTRRET